MKRLLAIVLSLGMLGILAAPVAAAPPVRDAALTSIAFNETFQGGGSFVGEYTATGASIVDGVLTLTGTLTGTATNAAGETLEISEALTGAVTAGGSPARCDILFLDLGPIFLDVLGLNVDLSQIVLDVYAVPGAGNLLGNLLCAVAGLLDGPNPIGNALTNLLGLINRILG